MTKLKTQTIVPLIDLNLQHRQLAGELRQAFNQVLDSGQFILGPFVEQFENDLAAYCGTKHAIGMSSGTDALLAAMMAAGIGPGDEVITSPFTFFATAGCIARLGARPVYVDIDSRTYNLDVDAIGGAITERTKAIMPVHLFGLTVAMDKLMAIAREHELLVIEDAAQAIGAGYRGQKAGAIGDVGCFSFYPTKNLPAMGDAGACVTNDDDLAQRLRQMRNHGMSDGYHHEHLGGNFRLDAMQAAMLRVKLHYLEEWCAKRREHAHRYNRDFERIAATTPHEPEGCHHVYNQYTIRVRAGQRDMVQHHLTACGVGSRVYYPLPMHLQPCLQDREFPQGSLPVAERACREVLSLPVFPEMTPGQRDRVVEALRDFFAAE